MADKKIEFTITIEYDSWIEKGREPKNKAEWHEWLLLNYITEAQVIGNDDGENQDMISIEKITLTVNKLS